MIYRIEYSGWDFTFVEAGTAEEAADKFWDEGKNALNDAVIESVTEEKLPL